MCENVEESGISVSGDDNSQMVALIRSPEPLVIPVEEPKKEWQLWRQQFSFFALATNLSTKSTVVQVATLMSTMGVQAQDIYNSFEFTEEQTLESVLKKFDEFFNPKANLIFERYVFNSMKQEESESFNAYLTRITNQGKTCEYESLTDMIRDRIVTGIRHDSVRQTLLSNPTLTLSGAIEICRACEARDDTEKQNLLLTNPTRTSVTVSREIVALENCESAIIQLRQILKEKKSQFTLDVNSTVTENVEQGTSTYKSKDHEDLQLTENHSNEEISSADELVDSDSDEATFTFKKSKFSRLQFWKDEYSQPCMIRNIPWRIIISKESYKNKPFLAVFIQCDGVSESSSWRCYATVELTLVAQMKGVSNITQKCGERFSPENDADGFPKFMLLEDVLDPNRGFIKDDTVIIQAHVMTMTADASKHIED